jgi:crotonobetainyl-CoA:carnitine CoA-transferase CaiB-like acyl-CoA transferase
MKGEVAKQEGNFHPTSPGTGMFQTADGYINIAASGDNLWRKFCEVSGDKDLASNPDFATVPLRAKNRQALIAHLNDVLRSKPSQFWVDELNKAGVPCGPIYQMDEVFADEQVKHLKMAASVHHPRLGDIEVVNQAVELSRTPSGVRYPTPEKGEHTDEVLGELGYDAAAIAELRKQKVV